ncbi:MAG: hypothetical protein D6815_05025 [Candidatus Dadabacteria bacterium]|nr:MAG: hypothetical protein D6815_05025 [Candidatus Dadabacteria bacterium]
MFGTRTTWWVLTSTTGGALLAGALFSSAVALPQGQGGMRYRAVILVSWDGVRPDVLGRLLHWQKATEPPRPCPSAKLPVHMPSVCGDELTCMPALCRFQIIASRDVQGKTMTRPQHAQMLSGYGPAVTRIRTNGGTSKLPPGVTIYERIHELVGPEIRMAHIAMPKYASRGIVRQPVRSRILRVDRPGGRDGYTGRNTLKRVIPVLEQFASGRFFYFIHFHNADKAAHRYGDGSARYLESIQSLDARLHELLQALGRLGIGRSTIVYVTTDHGFRGRRHVVLRYRSNSATWIASSAHDLREDLDATIQDITPTILDRLGADLSAVDPPFPGKSLLR